MEHFNWITGAVIPYFNFILFFVVLVWVARKPMKQMAEDRYRKYVDLHAEAKNAFEAAQKQNNELKTKLNSLQSEIEELRKISLENAKHEYDVLVAQARTLGAHIVDEARMIADAEVESAKEVIRQEIVKQLTMQVKEKIKSDLDAGKQKELVKKQFAKVERVSLEEARL